MRCVQCHDPHGSDNLFAIRKAIVVNPSSGTTTGPVVFTARSGSNSYDDGISDPASRLCVTCHASTDNMGYPMANHNGGANHLGGSDYTGQDCTTCHSHDPDSNRETLDGFMATGGGCTGCHSTAQDNGDGFPTGGRRAVVNEFGYTSHHVQGQVQDADCQVCHAETDNHADGYLQLADADNPSTIYSESFPGIFRSPNNGADLNNLTSFCESCHDGDGASGNITPLSDGQPSPLVSNHSNVDFSHGVEAAFQVACVQCHNSHGSGNLFTIKSAVVLNPSTGITSGPVVFASSSGNNSYDDGVSDPAGRLCVTCHASAGNPGYPMINHAGATNHLGGNDYAGQDCAGCHPHSVDYNQATQDGFMPVGGSCTSCHATAQDNGDGLPVGGRRAVVDEFGYASHHVLGQVQDSDCQLCHAETTSHADGYLQLADADNPATVYSETMPGAFRPETVTAANSKALQPFCLSCHDSDGAGGNTMPFSAGDRVVPDIEGGVAWNQSAHNTGESTNSGYGCMGDGITSGCHATGHGSNLKSLLSPSNGSPGPDQASQEEGFCYTCHDGSQGPDVQSEFARASHHDVDGGDQRANLSAVECSNCHNPHRNTAAEPLSDPDATDNLWPAGAGDRDFCLRCHDGDPPANVVFPATYSGTGWDKSSYVGSAHDIGLQQGGPECQHCHEPHGAGYDSLAKDQYIKTDFTSYSSGNYALCWTCHTTNDIVSESVNNSFGNRHYKHLREVRSPCIHCHDVHNGYDAGEPGLINLIYGVTKMDVNLRTAGGTNYNHSTAFRISGNTGYCYMQCHYGRDNQDHSPKTYSRTTINTIDNNCNTCHAGMAAPAEKTTVLHMPLIMKGAGP